MSGTEKQNTIKNPLPLEVDVYLENFEKLKLNDLVSNPFTLYIAAEVLPEIINTDIKISKFMIYKNFLLNFIMKEINKESNHTQLRHQMLYQY